jgi:hypothetical protein
MREAVRKFVELLREAKIWETEAEPIGKVASAREANAEAQPAGKVAGASKASSEPAGKAAGASKASSGPVGKAAGAEIEWHNEEGGNIANRLPEIYREWASVFSEEEINRLPDHTEYDHRIELIEGSVPPFGPIYPLSEKELQTL